MKRTKTNFQFLGQKGFLERRLVFKEVIVPRSQRSESIGDPGERYEAVDGSYGRFNDKDLASIQGQLSKYDSSWINKLPAEKKAEATRQWAYCLFMELGVRRASEQIGRAHV